MRKLYRFAHKHWKALILWAIGAGFVLFGLLLIWASLLQIPDLASIQSRKVAQSTKIYDRTGTVMLYNFNSDAQRTVVPMSDISPHIQNATVAIEDPAFYEHAGIKPTAILRAILIDIFTLSASQGGSTITQQVVKNTLLTNVKSIPRKLEEWVLALKLERTLTKQQILELYLNQSPYGGNVYGVEQAAETFFGKHASDVSVAEAAYLTAVLPAPSYYSPYGNHKKDLDARKNLVLDKMREFGYLTDDQLAAAKAEQVNFVPRRQSSIIAPHFVFYVEQYLEQKYGDDALQHGGWTIVSSLDVELQTKAEEVVAARAADNEKNFNATNAGMVGLDPTNGQILLMVGSRNYFDDKIQGNYNVTLADRQPGSAFKPFVYAKAFEEGYTPDTVVFDVPTQFSTACSPNDVTNHTAPCYAPDNYDGKFRGPMTFRDALAQSINVPAIKALYLAGINDSLEFAKTLGISTLGNAGQYGLTLVLGGGEVTLLDMTSAYGAFAQDGMKYPATSILKITDATGNIIEDNTQPIGTQVMPAHVAQDINDILSDPVARAPLGENTLFTFPGHDVAVKTGTTNDYKDAWTIGYTPNLVLGIWAGNNDNKSMVKKVSGFIVGPMWHDVMEYAVGKLPNQSFTRTETDISGLKPVLRGQWSIPGSDGVIHDILYWVDKTNPLGPAPANPANDPQYSYWDIPVRNWTANHGVTGSI